MPAGYWDRLTDEELHWHLKAIHAFFVKQAGTITEEIPIAVDWRHSPEEGCTRFVFCTWDQRRLLERITAAFNALRVSILAADVYTRTDNLVLDVFEAAEPGGGPLRDADRLNSLPFLVEGALSDPPRFAAVWATEFHKFAPGPPESEVRLGFDNRRSGDTLLRVEAPDRLGLLYDLLHVMSEHDLRVSQAIIETNEGLARDVFHFTDAGGAKVTNEAQLARLKAALIAALTS
jgi:[protein-PII] uridylyltransferase